MYFWNNHKHLAFWIVVSLDPYKSDWNKFRSHFIIISQSRFDPNIILFSQFYIHARYSIRYPNLKNEPHNLIAILTVFVFFWTYFISDSIITELCSFVVCRKWNETKQDVANCMCVKCDDLFVFFISRSLFFFKIENYTQDKQK